MSDRPATAGPCPRGGGRSSPSAGTSSAAAAGNEAIRDYMLALADRPRAAGLPAADGERRPDRPDRRLPRRASRARDCELSHVSLFRLEDESVDLAEHLLAQDLIYVGGGSMLNLLAIWRAHGVDEMLRRVLGARASCSPARAPAHVLVRVGGDAARPGRRGWSPGLGLVPGILSVHYHRDPDRRRAPARRGRAPGLPGYGVDDGAGMLIRGATVAASGQRPARRPRPGASPRTAAGAPGDADEPGPAADRRGRRSTRSTPRCWRCARSRALRAGRLRVAGSATARPGAASRPLTW